MLPQSMECPEAAAVEHTIAVPHRTRGVCSICLQHCCKHILVGNHTQHSASCNTQTVHAMMHSGTNCTCSMGAWAPCFKQSLSHGTRNVSQVRLDVCPYMCGRHCAVPQVQHRLWQLVQIASLTHAQHPALNAARHEGHSSIT